MNHEMIVAFYIIDHTFLFISHKPSKSYHSPYSARKIYP